MRAKLSSNEFKLMQKYIEEKCGVLLGEEKAYLIESRLCKLLIDSQLSSFIELYNMLIKSNDKSFEEKIINAMTTNETLWFRDESPWTILEEILLPIYIKQLRSGEKSKIRIWSAASSTGQEAYSTAMCIDNFLNEKRIDDIDLSCFEIIATDISREVLKIAGMGRYNSISIMRGLKESYKNKYFKSEGRVWKIDERIKNSIKFMKFNLQNSFLMLGKFDIIFCRYVMIYFSEKLKNEVLEKMRNSLVSNGVFFIGNSELINNYEQYFEKDYYKNAVYYKRGED